MVSEISRDPAAVSPGDAEFLCDMRSLPETPLKPEKDLKRPEENDGESIGRDEQRRSDELAGQNGPGQPGCQSCLPRNRQRFSHGASHADIARGLPESARCEESRKALPENRLRSKRPDAMDAHYSVNMTHVNKSRLSCSL